MIAELTYGMTKTNVKCYLTHETKLGLFEVQNHSLLGSTILLLLLVSLLLVLF